MVFWYAISLYDLSLDNLKNLSGQQWYQKASETSQAPHKSAAKRGNWFMVYWEQNSMIKDKYKLFWKYFLLLNKVYLF